MKYPKHPATIIAAVALFVALGGGAAAYASGLISGSQIENHSIAANKLTKAAIKSLRGQRGAPGVPGATGPTGPAGAQGVQGAIGPSDGFFRAGANGDAPLSLPAGSYIITARSYLVNSAVATDTCTLTAGSDTDTVSMTTTAAASGVVTMMVAHTFASAGQATVSCTGDIGDSERISAIKVGTLTIQ